MKLGEEIRKLREMKIKEQSIKNKFYKKFNESKNVIDEDLKIDYISLYDTMFLIEDSLQSLTYYYQNSNFRMSKKCNASLDDIETVEDFLKAKNKMKKSKERLYEAAGWIIGKTQMTQKEIDMYTKLEDINEL